MELSAIERETKRYTEVKATTEKDLESCRQKGVALEDVSNINIRGHLVFESR